jgi:iron complex transport system substrate-binding protein
MSIRLSRRSAVGGALLATPLLSRNVGAQPASPAASPASGEWSFTDDKGVTVTLPARPERVVIDVNVAAGLWDFGYRPVAVFGWNAVREGDFGPAGGNIDPAAVEIVGDVSEPINVEQLVGVDPDLIVTLTFNEDDPLDYWSIAADGPLEQVQQVAPIIALSGVRSADEITARHAELAAALGVNLEAPEVVAANDELTAAEAALADALASKPGISAMFVAPDAETIYIANPQVAGELQYLRAQGLTIPDVEINPENGDFWQYASLEEIGAYQTDLIFSSYRATLDIEAFTALPTVATLPAVVAGQVYTWNQDIVYSYQGLTDVLNNVTTAINESEIVTD